MDEAGPVGGEPDLRLIAHLAEATDLAINHLADVDATDDLEDFGQMLTQLLVTAAELVAQMTADGSMASKGDDVEAARVHLREARDLLDDGEPSGAVALEVMAARDLLRRPPRG